jgi:hypothetical protein
MSTYADLVIEVRAQIDVSDAVAYGWLLERARVLNAEAAWLLAEAQIPAVTGQGEYALPSDCVRTEAASVGAQIYRRATLTQFSEALAYGSPRPVYSDAAETVDRVFAISPPPTTGNTITLRYLADVPDEGPIARLRRRRAGRAGRGPIPIRVMR